VAETAGVAVRVLGAEPRLPERVRVGRPAAGPGPAVLRPHSDKAISQRAALLAALAGGTSRISGLADCRDVRANLDALGVLGIQVRGGGAQTAVIAGRDFRALRAHGLVLDAGNSATTSRLLLSTLAGSGADCVVTGNAALRRRPMAWICEPLRAMGARLEYAGEPGRLPVSVRGRRLHGADLEVTVDSAQAVSALLFAGTLADGPVRIRRRTAARDHTERLLRWTGLDVEENEAELRLAPGRPAAFDLAVPGDPSGAAVLAALHLASPRAAEALTLQGVCANERRTGFFRALAAMGVAVHWRHRSDAGIGAGPEPVADVSVRAGGRLRGAVLAGRAHIQSMIDEIPLLAALATAASGPTVVRDAAELRDKDTDRIATTVALLRAFGGRAAATADGLVVEPSVVAPPAQLRLPADHRVAFAALVLTLLAGGGVELHGADAMATSYPGILTDLSHYVPMEVTPR